MSGLYIHIPYCHSKCAYCDFYSTPNTKNIEQYVEALILEFKLRIDQYPHSISTIYIGGGTPSILPIYLLKKIIRTISQCVDISTLVEFTIEANPEDVTLEWLKAISGLGINRVSIGIQSFSDIELEAINRRHSAATAHNAIDILKRGGVSLISGDLIYGLPKQDINSWKKSLDTLMQLQLPHFSSYLLSYEPGTKLYARLKSGKVEEASEELIYEMYNYLVSTAKANGYIHYEISNFALPGYEAIHNSNYWKGLPYLGIGVSAHSYDGNKRSYNPSNVNKYIASMQNNQCFYEVEPIDENSRHNDYIIVSLRTLKGVDIKAYKSLFGAELYNRMMQIANQYIKAGKMTLSDTNLAIVENAMLTSDSIMVDFII